MTLGSDPDLLVRIKITLIHEKRVVLIDKDETIWESSNRRTESFEPSLDNHPGKEARDPKDLPPAKTFKI